MKSIILVAFIITCVAAHHGRNHSYCNSCIRCVKEECPKYFVYDPRCGKRERYDGYWEYRIFEHQCEMDNVNLCGGGYVPCCWFKEMISQQ